MRPRHGILILQTLFWEDELRDPGDIAPSAPVTDRELELAEVLIRELTGIEVRELHDEYAHALEQLGAGGAPTPGCSPAGAHFCVAGRRGSDLGNALAGTSPEIT